MSTKEIIVNKFGGTSVGTTDRIKQVANICEQVVKSNKSLIVVVSAMGHTTDELTDLMNEITNNPAPREKDLLLSSGEQVSISLLAMALQTKGIKAKALLGWQAGIQTEDAHNKARIQYINSDYLQEELQEQEVLIVAGFQGITSNNKEITTLGRGGSDTSAVALAVAVNAIECNIYTDVNFVRTTDPRIVSEAGIIQYITYDEMLELAQQGAQVLHPRSVEIAKNNNIPMRVRSTWEPENTGTLVTTREQVMNKLIEGNPPVRGVALDTEQAYLSIIGVPDKPGIASQIFCQLAEQNISVDLIVQSVSRDNITEVNFTTSKEDSEQAYKVLEQIKEEINAKEVKLNTEVAKVSIVGAGMIDQVGVASTMFETLGNNNINIHIISTSEIRISCVVDECNGQDALKVIHQAFNLDKVVQ